MTQSALAFKDVTNGRARDTDGYWLHRGKFVLRDQNGALGDGNALIAENGTVILGGKQPRLSPNGVGTWADSHLRIDQSFPSEPRIGFHEAGNSAICIYKPSGQNTLRMRGNGGEDYPMVGAPGTFQALIGQWDNASGWAVPQANVWTETEVRANFTGQGNVQIRVEFTTSVEPPAGVGGVIYLAVGLDGSLPWTARQVWSIPSQATGGTWPMAGTFYPPVGNWSLGLHRLSLFMYASAAGTHFSAAIATALYVTEQRA